jgi:uncharacterized protein YcfL
MDLLQKDVPILTKIYEAKCFYDSQNNRIILYYKNHVTARTLVDFYNLPTTPPPNSSLYVIYDLQTGTFNVSTDPPTYTVSNSKVYVTSPINAEYDIDKVIIYRISWYETDTVVSQTPAPNVIVPLNADGVLDLSQTYVRSSVYTIRRINGNNLTSDYPLEVGEEAIYTFSTSTPPAYVPLRIATNPYGVYQILIFDYIITAPNSDLGHYDLLVNNTAYTNMFRTVFAHFYENSSVNVYTHSTTGLYFEKPTGGIVFALVNVYNRVALFDTSVNVAVGNTIPTGRMAGTTRWIDKSTPWTSLGTMFCNSTNGLILVRRLA